MKIIIHQSLPERFGKYLWSHSSPAAFIREDYLPPVTIELNEANRDQVFLHTQNDSYPKEGWSWALAVQRNEEVINRRSTCVGDVFEYEDGTMWRVAEVGFHQVYPPR